MRVLSAVVGALLASVTISEPVAARQSDVGLAHAVESICFPYMRSQLRSGQIANAYRGWGYVDYVTGVDPRFGSSQTFTITRPGIQVVILDSEYIDYCTIRTNANVNLIESVVTDLSSRLRVPSGDSRIRFTSWFTNPDNSRFLTYYIRHESMAGSYSVDLFEARLSRVSATQNELVFKKSIGAPA
jgi:hypothetical protein